MFFKKIFLLSLICINSASLHADVAPVPKHGSITWNASVIGACTIAGIYLKEFYDTNEARIASLEKRIKAAGISVKVNYLLGFSGLPYDVYFEGEAYTMRRYRKEMKDYQNLLIAKTLTWPIAAVLLESYCKRSFNIANSVVHRLKRTI